jgi:hypothetical protein
VIKLINLLQLLIDVLNKNRKVQLAIFFEKKRDEITLYENDIKQTRQTLKLLSTCRAMAQHADFSLIEEKYLDDIINESIFILKSTIDK